MGVVIASSCCVVTSGDSAVRRTDATGSHSRTRPRAVGVTEFRRKRPRPHEAPGPAAAPGRETRAFGPFGVRIQPATDSAPAPAANRGAGGPALVAALPTR